MSAAKRISIIIPARNEEALIARCVRAALDAAFQLHPGATRLEETAVEILVVDNRSDDRTVEQVRPFVAAHGVELVSCARRGSSCARNDGARRSAGELLCFVDADTIIPRDALRRILELRARDLHAGIFRLVSLEGGVRAFLWWEFWNLVRMLPLARAKAMPAFMFCTREVFERGGGFREGWAIAEEWPILAGLYRRSPERLVYDRALTARSSSRRMELRPFGYSRTLLKYVCAVLLPFTRGEHTDRIRHSGTGLT